MEKLSAVVGPETIRSYKRLAYETWWAMAEFIDNSSQSFLSNQTELERVLDLEGRRFEVLINYAREQNEIRISDNAMGMSLAEVERAVHIGQPPDDRKGRHEFGMGLKTAACWLGDLWTLRTTRLGDPNEYEITFDVERVASGDADLRLRTLVVPAEQHYTVLTISKMHQRISGRLQGRLLENLRSIYRFDTRDGVMRLCWGDQELKYDDRLVLLKAADGAEYRKEFSFDVHGKVVRGWAGILESGGRPRAGFAVARRGRLVMSQPDAWRPQSLFGQIAGTNDLVNQRLVGEIHLDDFEISHTKNQILWQNDELDVVEDELKKLFQDYRSIAQNRRVKGDGGPSSQEQTIAIDAIKHIVQDQDFVDLVTLGEVPAPELVDATFEPLREAVATRQADQTFVLGQYRIKLFMDSERSPNDPYFLGDYVSDDVISVCVNMQHPFWVEKVVNAQDMVIFVLNCIYDALAEWKCMKLTGEIRPDTVKVVKDGYMRQAMDRG
jgi:hypothetical protein